MATRPQGALPWPPTQRQRLERTIELAEHGVKLLNEARKRANNREHPALVALDIADAVCYLKDIIKEMKDAQLGIPPEETI